MKPYVLVLFGGRSNEREVSVVTGNAVTQALIATGYKVKSIDVGENIESILANLDPTPDVVFNALHGRYGEDGNIQGLLNYLDIKQKKETLNDCIIPDFIEEKIIVDEIS